MAEQTQTTKTQRHQEKLTKSPGFRLQSWCLGTLVISFSLSFDTLRVLRRFQQPLSRGYSAAAPERATIPS
jgi:hypothetical protein